LSLAGLAVQVTKLKPADAEAVGVAGVVGTPPVPPPKPGAAGV
jgi:hypothetical protein